MEGTELHANLVSTQCQAFGVTGLPLEWPNSIQLGPTSNSSFSRFNAKASLNFFYQDTLQSWEHLCAEMKEMLYTNCTIHRK